MTVAGVLVVVLMAMSGVLGYHIGRMRTRDEGWLPPDRRRWRE